MRTIQEALAPYGARDEWAYAPLCDTKDGNPAQWVIVYPGQVPNLFVCFTHYEQWTWLVENTGSLGRPARLA
jgi:hypothetical protein